MTTVWCLDMFSFGLFWAWRSRTGIQSHKFTRLAVTEFRAVCLPNWELFFFLLYHLYTVAGPTLVQTQDPQNVAGGASHIVWERPHMERAKNIFVENNIKMIFNAKMLKANPVQFRNKIRIFAVTTIESCFESLRQYNKTSKIIIKIF